MNIIQKIASVLSFRDAGGVPLAWRGDAVSLFASQLVNSTSLIASSSYVDCRPGNKISVELTLTFAGTPTSIEIIARFRRNGQTEWQEYRMGEWNYLSYSKAEIDAITAPVADTLRDVLTVDAINDEFSLALLGAGTTGIATFTVTVVATPIKI